MKEKIADSPEKSHPNNQVSGLNAVKLVIGDPLDQRDLDCIVSFLSEDLSWGGPVNQQLLNAVGSQLDEHVLQNVVRPTLGVVFSTPSFGLPFKSLIFGVIDRWDAGLNGEERQFKNTIKSILQHIQKSGYSSLGIPAVGADRHDMPIRRAARMMFSAIADTPLTSLREIRLLCKNEAVFDSYNERREDELSAG